MQDIGEVEVIRETAEAVLVHIVATGRTRWIQKAQIIDDDPFAMVVDDDGIDDDDAKPTLIASTSPDWVRKRTVRPHSFAPRSRDGGTRGVRLPRRRGW